MLPPPPPFGPFDARQSPDARFEALTSIWRERLAARDCPGGAIAVVLDGRLRFAAGVGSRTANRDEPVTATTRFRTASISKMLVAATILSLAERDGLSLDRPVTDYVPYFRRGAGFDASAVTLEMLLTHTGGVPDSVFCPDGASLRVTLDAHAGDPYWAPPGRLFDYSNFDYALLAAVIEETTHRPFEEVVTERILRPSGMRTASYEAREADATLARGHAGARAVWTHPTDCEASRAAGGVVASVTDFAHFAELLLAGGGGVLSADSVAAMGRGRALMSRAPREMYGYGLVEGSHAGLRTLEHGGSAYGFSTFVRMVPSQGFAVVAFVNGNASVHDVVDAATSAFLGVPEVEPPQVPPVSAWPDYVGRYEDPVAALGRFHVYLDGDRLRVQLDGGQRPLFDTVRFGTFVRDAQGAVEYFVTRVGVARRVR